MEYNSTQRIIALYNTGMQEESVVADEKINYSSIQLTEWQNTQLYNISKKGVECLLRNWFSIQNNLEPGSYCNVTWDSLYCWPPTVLGETVTIACEDILIDTEEYSGATISGYAHRVCLENGTWLRGTWTNYTECIASLENNDNNKDKDMTMVVAVRYILFLGSILSCVCLVTSLFIFYYFKCLRSDRVTVHINLMIALLMRCILLIIITEPFIFHRTNHYRQIDFICKIVLSTNLYATASSINWMFIQGHYLNAKLTTNVFNRGTPFKIYYLIGWGLPLVLIIAWTTFMENQHPVHCWKNYGDLPYIWIIRGPMIFALFMNLIFVINTLRILLTKIQLANISSDVVLIRRAVKATIILFPLLGINNLFVVYNPGGHYSRILVILNSIFQALQGLFVAILYCFMGCDVRQAIYREWCRFLARRSTNNPKGRFSSRKHSSQITETLEFCSSRKQSTSTVNKIDFRNIFIRNDAKSNAILECVLQTNDHDIPLTVLPESILQPKEYFI